MRGRLAGSMASEELADSMDNEAIADLFSGLGPVEVRRLFGGKGIYHNGLIVAVAKIRGELMLKVDAERARERRRRRAARQSTYTARGTEASSRCLTGPCPMVRRRCRRDDALAKKAYEAAIRLEVHPLLGAQAAAKAASPLAKDSGMVDLAEQLHEGRHVVAEAYHPSFVLFALTAVLPCDSDARSFLSQRGDRCGRSRRGCLAHPRHPLFAHCFPNGSLLSLSGIDHFGGPAKAVPRSPLGLGARLGLTFRPRARFRPLHHPPLVPATATHSLPRPRCGSS